MEKLKDLKCEEIVFLLKKAIRTILKKREKSTYDCAKLGNQLFYSVQVNTFLMNNCLDTMSPLLTDKWPKEFKDMITSRPRTGYSYVNSVLGPPFVSLPLYFGYAVVDKELRKTLFFVSNGKEVIDPISVIIGIKPDYYFGSPVNKIDLEVYMSTFCDPLESFVNRQKKAVKSSSRHSHHASLSDGFEYL